MAKPKLGSGKRFKQLSAKLGKKGAENPDALAAWIGRKKYGKKKFQGLSTKGRMKKHNPAPPYGSDGCFSARGKLGIG